jgi:hypothetical protein
VAAHAPASVDVQDSSDVSPTPIDVGDALMVIVGFGTAAAI